MTLLSRAGLLLVCGAALASGAGARQAAPPDTTVRLPDLTVTAARVEMPTRAAPVRVTVIDAEAGAAAGARSAADLLEGGSGAFMRRYGAGGLASVSLRGAGAAQTLILLDGHRIADPQLGQLDLSLLPALLLQSVEVMHGAGSALYGTDGLGGVVNLRARAPGAGMRMLVSGGAGGFGERNGGVLAAGGRGRFSVLALAERDQSEGDYAYFNEALFPARLVPREGADRRTTSVFGSLRYTGARRQMRLSGWRNDAERGLPTIGGTRPRGERQWDEHRRLWTDYDAAHRWGTLHVGALVQQSALRYANPQLRTDDTGRARVGSAEVEARTPAGRDWLAAVGAGAGWGRAEHPSLLAGAAQQSLNVFAHGMRRWKGAAVFPALRADAYLLADTLSYVALSPRLGLNAPLFGEALRLKAAAGRAFRAPTFNDRFWQPGGRPDLRPEYGWTYDAGLAGQAGLVQAEATGFWSEITDQIVWTPNAAGVWAPANLARVRSRGLELSAQARTPGRVGAGAGLFYTLTDARDRSEAGAAEYGRPVRYVPRRQAKAHAEARAGFASVGLDGRYVGRRYVSTDGAQALKPYFVLDAHARLEARRAHMRAALSFLVENALDRTYSVLQNYPMPPRLFRLRLLLDLES